MEQESPLETAVKSVHVWYVTLCRFLHKSLLFLCTLIILEIVLSPPCRTEMWFVHHFPALPCLVVTLFVVLETVVHGKHRA